MFNGLVNQVGRNMAEYHRANEQISTERRINRISDDPAGLAMVLRHSGSASAFDQYTENIRDAEEYLRGTDTALARLQDLLIRAREIAEKNATETSTEMERQVAADQIQELINEAIGISNTRVRDRYLFSGTNGEFPAFSLQGRILQPLASTDNLYNDIVTSGGTFNGTAEFTVRFVQGGNVGESGLPTTAWYQISSDGGETWSDDIEFTNLSIPMIDADGNDTGLYMTFSPGTMGEGDVFRLQVVPGKYMGDSGHIEFNNNMFSRINTNVNGVELFEDTDYFENLYTLKNALRHGNNLEISGVLAHMESLQTDMQRMVVNSGIALNRIQITRNNLTSLRENVRECIQAIEKVDVVDTLTRFAMAENALQASIAALGQLFPRGLISYL